MEGEGRGPNSSERARHSLPSKNRGLYMLSLRKDVENGVFPQFPATEMPLRGVNSWSPRLPGLDWDA